jgi:long-subunit fatty acid transport protein
VNSSEIETYFIGLGIGWKPEKPWRFGASAGLLGTWYQADQSATARDLTGGDSGTSIAVLRTSGVSYDLRVNLGLQADLGQHLALGVAVRSPGLHIWDSADVTYDLFHTDTEGTSQATFRDTAASTSYRYPLEGTLGLAYRDEDWSLEFDVTAYDSIDEYTFLGSEQSIKATAGGAVAETPFSDVRISAEPVVNFALGGRVRLSESWQLHAGVYTDYSPAPEDGKVFDKVDLYGATVGVSILVRPRSYWIIGLNYLHGSNGLATRDLATGTPISTDVAVSTLSAVIGTMMVF